MEASRLPLPDLVAGAVCASVGLAAFSALCSGGSAPSAPRSDLLSPTAARPERRLTPPPPRLNLRAAAAAASAGSPAKQTQWSPQLHEAELSRTRSGGRSSAESGASAGALRSPWRHLRQTGAAKTPVGQGGGADQQAATQQEDAQDGQKALSGPSPALVRQAAVAMLEEQQQALEQLRRECDGLKAALREVEAQRREPASPPSRAPPSAIDDGRSPAEREPARAGEWRAGFDAARNKPYFYNTATKETRWQSTTPEAGEQGEAAAEPAESAAEDTAAALDRSSAFRPYEHRRGAQAEASPGALEEQWSRDWWRTGGAEGSAQQPRSWRFTPSPVRPCPPALRTLARCFFPAERAFAPPILGRGICRRQPPDRSQPPMCSRRRTQRAAPHLLPWQHRSSSSA